MNIEEAILAHARWKIRLMTYLKNPDGSINANDVGVDNKCELGTWIHGHAADYASIPEYSALKAAHAKFHRTAANIVRKADSGRALNEVNELGLQSEFGMVSKAVVNALKSLVSKVG